MVFCVQLGVPVVRAWFHQGGKLEPVSFASPSHAVHPTLMMVHYNNQYYLQPVEWEGKREQFQLEPKVAGARSPDSQWPAARGGESIAAVRRY